MLAKVQPLQNHL